LLYLQVCRNAAVTLTLSSFFTEIGIFLTISQRYIAYKQLKSKQELANKYKMTACCQDNKLESPGGAPVKLNIQCMYALMPFIY
jgi:hypothetical protein